MMSENVASAFEKNGYIHVKDVVDTKTIADLRAIFLNDMASQNTHLLVDTIIHYPQLRELLLRPKVLDALMVIIGKPFIVLPPSSVDHNRFGQFHTDTSAAELAGWTFHKDPKFNAVVLALYLQDNNDYGGGLRVVPGTHRKPDMFVPLLKQKHKIRAKVDGSPWRRFLKKVSNGRMFNWRDESFENIPDQIDVPTKTGDILIWDMRLVHRASPKRLSGDVTPGGKLAVFYVLGANNDPTRKWAEYLTATGELDKIRSKGTAIPAPTENYIVL